MMRVMQGLMGGLDLGSSILSCVRITWQLGNTASWAPPQGSLAQEGWAGAWEPGAPDETDAAARRTTHSEPVFPIFCDKVLHPLSICKGRKLANSLLQTIPPPLCPKVCLVIKQELPWVHITFLRADSQWNLMLTLRGISTSVNWRQCQLDRT